jgi:hypothetical protein
MTTGASDFQKRTLYTQNTVTEEGYKITSTIYGIRWTYPGATQKTTGRLRITCVYTDDEMGVGITTIGGTIERWSDKAWLHIDDYCDQVNFVSKDNFRDRLLSMAESFIMGVPIHVIEGPRSVYNPPSLATIPKKFKPKVLEFDASKKNKKQSVKSNDNYTKEDTSSSDDDDDFEFI